MSGGEVWGAIFLFRCFEAIPFVNSKRDFHWFDKQIFILLENLLHLKYLLEEIKPLYTYPKDIRHGENCKQTVTKAQDLIQDPRAVRQQRQE